MPDNINTRIENAKIQIGQLKDEIDKVRASKRDSTLGAVVRSNKTASPLAHIRAPPATKVRRTLKGHFGKVTAMHWAGDSQSLVSASQDGNLILWNAVTTNKIRAISLSSNYVMTVGLEQTKGNLVASGGLDNLCTIYKWDAPNTAVMELASHDGFLSGCRFRSEQDILTSSGDSTLIRWDIESGRVLDTFAEHAQDVMSLTLCPTNPNLFCSGSVDTTAKIWDIRDATGSMQTFRGHDADINGVDFMSDGLSFGTVSDDGTARIFDLRAYNEVSRFGRLVQPTHDGDAQEGFTSISFSRSGRILFAGHSDASVLAWDVLSDKSSPAFILPSPHESHVSCLGVNPKGDALCTGSWDATLKIWA